MISGTGIPHSCPRCRNKCRNRSSASRSLWRNIQAVHQITAEQFFAGKLIDAFIGGGNNADIDGDDLVITNSSDLTFLEDPQQLGLGGKGNFTDLIQKQGSAVRLFKESHFAAFDAAGKGALHIAKELAFQQIFR